MTVTYLIAHKVAVVSFRGKLKEFTRRWCIWSQPWYTGWLQPPPPFPLVLKNFEQNAHDEKYGDRGLPCRTQRVRLKKSEDEPIRSFERFYQTS